MRTGLGLFLLAALVWADDGEKPRTPINEYFSGKVVRVQNGRVTFHYDFAKERQLKDFEEWRPADLFDKERNAASVVAGRLVLERSSGVRHRMVGQGRIEARFLVNAKRKADVGAVLSGPLPTEPYALTTIWEGESGRFSLRADGVELAFIDSKVVTPQIRPREDCEMEFGRDGARVWTRLGIVHRQGELKAAMPRHQFGFWAHKNDAAFDELVLTIEPTQAYLDDYNLTLDIEPKAPPLLAKTADGKLLKLVRAAPLSVEAKQAMAELSRRGPKQWEKLSKVATALAKKRPYAAVPALRALADGAEPERRKLVWELFKRFKAPDVRLSILLSFTPTYPDGAAQFHAGLQLKIDGRRELLRALAYRGLPDDVVAGCLEDELLAKEAYEILRGRGVDLTELDFGVLPLQRAAEGQSPRKSLAFAQEFFETRNWPLLRELVKLIQHKDPRVAEGAYMMVLSVAGKDIAPDNDLWQSWISAKLEGYKPPTLGSPGPVAAAILRGRAFLRKDLLEDGVSKWPTTPDWPGTKVGATALSVLALRAAGVPKNDEAIDKALHTMLLYSPTGQPALRGDMEDYTYALTLLTMALASVDRERFKPLIMVLGRNIARGQLQNGQWTYNCRGKDYKRRPLAGDNSNTQYAILALRAVRRAGVAVPDKVFDRTAKFWLQAVNPYGGWGYGPKGSFHHELSMTAAGISTLAICAEALHGPKAQLQILKEKRVSMGQLRLGELLLAKGYQDEEIYAMYGVERACILTGTRAFNDFDWYFEGCKILLEAQKENGAWGNNSVRGVTTGYGYGESCDTAFALLFLKRSTTRLAGSDGPGMVKVPKMRRPVKPR